MKVLTAALFAGLILQNPAPRTPATSASSPAVGVPSVVRVGIAKPGGGYTVTTLPFETYVARVIAGEAARDSQPAALEALAITIRTFALANPGRHRADGFDLCDQTHCQVLRPATAATERAAQATAGRVLVYNGAAASVYYTASCGGRTEIPSHVWPGSDDPPFLPSQDDDACQGAPAWVAEIDGRNLARALRAAGFAGDRLRDLRVESHHSGRVAKLKVEGLRPDEISGQDLRVAVGRTLGWQHIQSTAFELQRRGDTYRFSGHGAGHGVGLCVIGSARLAERGVAADAILARYFPGLQILGNGVASGATPSIPPASPSPRGQTPPREARGADPKRPVSPTPAPGRGLTSGPARGLAPNGANLALSTILVTLSDEDEGERAVIVQQTLRARDEIARALGVPAPSPVKLRFHPTTDDYERGTDRAWFTSGALVGGELHLLPLAVLRERGVLERTIRHELVHLMTDSVLDRRSQWVREGAAIYFAGTKPIPGEPRQWPPFRPDPRASCPADNELLRPVSIGALANAYTRARDCFAKQIAAGKSWRDVH